MSSTSLRAAGAPLLQLALDLQSTREASAMARAVYPSFDILEVGTPLIIEEGLAALERLHDEFPDRIMLADLKIMDAGHLEAASGFRRGADILTVLGAADDATVRGALAAAAEHGGEVMVDLINVRDQVSRARALADLGVRLLCVHTAHDLTGSGGNPLRELESVRAAVGSRLAVAGGLGPENAAQAVESGADIVVVGSAITGGSDPRAVAREILDTVARAARSRNVTAAAGRAGAGSEARSAGGASVGAEGVLSRIGGELRDCLGRISRSELRAALERLEGAPRIFAAGAGRSGLMLRAFAMRLMHAGKVTHVVGDPTTPALTSGDLLVLGSGSGRTATLLAMARKARELRAGILLVTIDAASPIAELADTVLVVNAPSPKLGVIQTGAASSAQPMGSLFEQALLLVLDGLVLLLMEHEGIAAEEMFRRHANLE